jgi:hypothetical protein
MKHTPIFSAVIGNHSTLGFFDVYADFSCVWQHGKTKVIGTVNTGTLESYLEIAQQEGKKYIAGAQVQEYYIDRRALEEADSANNN